MRLRAAAFGVAAVLVAACNPAGPAPLRPVSVSPSGADAGRKVMIIVEENHSYGQIIDNPRAAYVNKLAATYGTAAGYQAGYPARCPSLAAYILMTSGTTDRICDDRGPAAHPLSGDNIFHQVSRAGRQWRAYAEAAPGACPLTNQGRYLVRHVPATYYRDERGNCGRWVVPLGNPGRGALHADVTNGTLPSYAFVSPDACSDMHGAPDCRGDLIAAADRWLHGWLPQVMAGPDYRAGRLTVVITWDEGTPTDNHIPALVIAPSVHHVTSGQPLSHCSTLRFAEQQLHLPLLGCAAGATSLGSPFGL